MKPKHEVVTTIDGTSHTAYLDSKEKALDLVARSQRNGFEAEYRGLTVPTILPDCLK